MCAGCFIHQCTLQSLLRKQHATCQHSTNQPDNLVVPLRNILSTALITSYKPAGQPVVPVKQRERKHQNGKRATSSQHKQCIQDTGQENKVCPVTAEVNTMALHSPETFVVCFSKQCFY